MLANKTQEQTDAENRETCIRIAKELEAIADGKYYRCPECGQLYMIDDETDDETPHTCPECGAEIEDPEQAGFYDYFDDALDIEYRINGSGEYRSVEICVACGGPNIYIDTGSRLVKLFWWSDRAESPIFGDACSQIDDVFEEMYSCIR